MKIHRYDYGFNDQSWFRSNYIDWPIGMQIEFSNLANTDPNGSGSKDFPIITSSFFESARNWPPGNHKRFK